MDTKQTDKPMVAVDVQLPYKHHHGDPYVFYVKMVSIKEDGKNIIVHGLDLWSKSICVISCLL